MISRNDYDSFGEIVASSGVSQNAVTYTGQRLDVESGLMALGNGERYYNPSYGRFIQQDRFAGLPQMPQSLNRFSYAHNNPTKYTDPSGNVIPLIPIVVGALAFAGAFLIGVTVVENEKIVRERNEEFIKQGVDSSTLPNSTATAVFNSAPVIGSGFKAYFGQDTITGEDLNWFWRGVEGASTILDALPVLIRAKGLRNAPRLFKAKEVAKQSDEIIDDGLDIAKNVSRTEDGAEKVAESAKRWEDYLPDAQKIKEQTRQRYGFNEVSDQISLMDKKASRKLLSSAENKGYTKVDYENFDLAQKALDYRKGRKYWQSDANIATVEFVQDGLLRTKTIKSINAMNVPKGSQYGHSEKLLLENLETEGIDLNSVTRLFTERSPCPKCNKIVQSKIPNARVFYSFEYGNDNIMKSSVDILRKSLGLTKSGDIRKR